MDPSLLLARLNHLADRYFAGESTAEELAELQQLLVTSPQAAEAFTRRSRLEADLTDLFADEQALRRESEIWRAVERSQRRRLLLRRGSFAVAAAVVALAASALFLLWGPAPTPSPNAEAASLVSGRLLAQGKVVDHLVLGALCLVADDRPAVLRWSNGSQATLEPASQFVLGSAEPGEPAVKLLAGAGRFVIPEARPFAVLTPVGRVAVLGTEFTLNLNVPADPDAEDEEEGDRPMRNKLNWQAALLAVTVMSGVVQVEVNGTQYRLTGGESRLFARDDEGGARKKEGDGRRKDGERPAPGRRGLTRGVIQEVGKDSFTINQGREGREELTTIKLSDSIAIVIDGQVGKLSGLSKGMTAIIYKDEKGNIVRIQADGPMVSGQLKAVATTTITLNGRGREGEAAKDMVIPLSPDVRVIWGRNRPLPMADLKAGDSVRVTLSADKKTAVVVYKLVRDGEGGGGRENGDGLPRAGGTISAIDTKLGTIALSGGERGEQKFSLTKDVKVTIDGKPAKLTDVKAGARASFTLDKDDKTTVTAIEIGSAPRPRGEGDRKREK